MLVEYISYVWWTEIPAQGTASRVSQLVEPYPEILASAFGEVTSAGSRGQSPVLEVIGDSEKNDREGYGNL